MGATQLNQLLTVHVSVVTGPLKGKELDFIQPEILIGRSVDNHIALSEDPKISRVHVQIRQTKSSLIIKNMTEKNHLIIDGELVNEIEKKSNFSLKVGDSELFISADFPSVAVIEKPDFTKIHSTFKPQNPPKISQPATEVIGQPVNNPQLSVPMPSITQQPLLNSKNEMLNKSSYSSVGYHAQISKNKITGSPKINPGSASSYLDEAEKVKKQKFAIIAVIIIGVLYFFLSDNNVLKKARQKYVIRGADQIELDMTNSENAAKEFSERKEKMSDVQFKRAQENYIKGFRDFRSGQYARAKESFQVVLNLDPENELAKRYYNLSKLKFDELVKFNLLQGQRYKEKQNYRMCKSSFANVMIMLQNEQNSTSYKEAEQYYKECDLASTGRY